MRSGLLVVLACCCSLVLMSGCRNPRVADGEDLSGVEQLDGNYALSDRFEDGIRVTDVSFEPIYFAYDSFTVDSAQANKIARVADYMRRNSQVRLVIEGHCDERGSREYNVSLGENRALAIRAQLIAIGIPANRIQTRSYGEENPVDPGHTEAAWRKNRRGEFALYR